MSGDLPRDEIRADRAHLREALEEKLRAEFRPDLANRIAKCGLAVHLRCTECGRTKECQSRCDLKWCPSCQHALAARTSERYARIMAKVQWPLRVTLTAQNYDYAEPSAVRHLRRAWGKLRRLRWFRNRVRGGVVGFEITDTGNGYHAHAHALFDCQWFAVTVLCPRTGSDKRTWSSRGRAAAREVSEQWSLCCGRPASMQVRRVWRRDAGDIRPALAECLKYATKGTDLAKSGRPAAPLIDQVDKTRMVTSFGTLFGLPEFKRRRPEPIPCECGSVGTFLPDELVPAHVRRCTSMASPNPRAPRCGG